MAGPPVLGLTVPVAPSAGATAAAVSAHADDAAIEAGEGSSLLQRQRSEVARQDDTLDAMAVALERLAIMSRDISTEVTSQSVIIEEVSSEVAETTLSMDVMTKRVNKLIKESGGCGWFSAIVVLAIIAFVLLLIIIFF